MCRSTSLFTLTPVYDNSRCPILPLAEGNTQRYLHHENLVLRAEFPATLHP